MSGGVDSSVAAHLLRAAGYDCVGVFMRTGAHASESASCAAPLPSASSTNSPNAGGASDVRSLPIAAAPRRLKHGCCSATDAQDARSVAARLGIPFYALNLEAEFGRIIDYFISEYAAARTPNPCVMCNTEIKFGRLLEYADLLEAEFIATGHYARVVRDAVGGVHLARAHHLDKDQSYVLAGIQRAALRRCLFPLGEVPDKATVRRLAAELDLPVHDKPDSQEICFVPDNDYKRLLAERRPEILQTGEMRSTDGRLLRRHEGVAGFTIGQRHGLGVALGEPAYVTHLDAVTNTVTVGPRTALLAEGLLAERFNWLSDAPPVGRSFAATVKIRHMHSAAAATVTRRVDEQLEVCFAAPQSAVTPGQAVVLYDGDLVLGGGWIARALSTPAR